MKFSKIFFFVFVAFFFACSVIAAPAPAPEPKWKIFKKLEKAGRRIRDGIIKAGPAVSVVGQAATVLNG